MDDPGELPLTRVAIALVWHEGRLAVGRRQSGSHLAGHDEWPGGKIESGESPSLAACRESLEETGLRVEAIGTRQVVRHTYADRALELHFVDCQLAAGESAANLRPPFAWWDVRSVLAGNFPAANQSVLDTLRRDLKG